MPELRTCHGPYRGKECPVCGKPGKILMNEREVDEVSRTLAAILRHDPERYHIRLDSHGYARIAGIVSVLRKAKGMRWITFDHIVALAETDPKGRYQVSGVLIRAMYGHTIPVDLSDLPDDNIPETLYYQSSAAEAPLVKEAGIYPSDKSWIHLSGTYRRSYVSGLYHIDDPFILRINARSMIEDGHEIYRSSDDIYLTKEIPPEYISDADHEDVTLTEEEKMDIERVRNKNSRKDQ
ncbi:RNA 2'-phosphotransferase [Thermoplasma sp.]|uniref:RNA 2'-phosphotransferase n=1 Tax=Thermoplasma sp. TaxID=1973142 RepID=UPI001279730F|nr:RNA 2'-phosphotransferase [Thermoplasma sp.]KAA8922307.1 MAG: RNA 2'-phosphotransferase [Thermoplasma sp.]